MRQLIAAAAVAVALVGAVATAAAQKPAFGSPARAPRSGGIHHSLSVTLFHTTWNDPFLREPNTAGFSSSEIQTGQKVGTIGGRVGWLATLGRAGLEVGVSFLRVGLADFRYRNPPMFDSAVTYSGVSIALVQADFLLLFKPARDIPLHVYGVLGMGQSRRAYTLSGSPFPEWDGPRKTNEFGYSWGFGLRLSPIRQFALFAEYRWVPGDLTSSIPAGGCYVYYSRAGRAGISASLDGTGGSASIPDCKPATQESGNLLSLGAALAVP
jgi:opacity protein-like surface antigen